MLGTRVRRDPAARHAPMVYKGFAVRCKVCTPAAAALQSATADFFSVRNPTQQPTSLQLVCLSSSTLPPPSAGCCVSGDHVLQTLRVTAVHRAPRTRTEHARHAVDWLEGRVPQSKFRIHHEMRRAPEPQTTAAAFFVTSSALGTLTHLKIVVLSQTYLPT